MASNIPVGPVTRARLLLQPPSFIKPERHTGARAQGLRFESEALSMLERRSASFGEFLRSPWIEYCDGEGRKFCQPDGILLPEREPFALVIEVKLRHCYDAWFQLVRLYTPVLETLFPQSQWRACEIVRWFDSASPFPEPIVLTPDPLTTTNPKRIAVHIFNPQKERNNAEHKRNDGQSFGEKEAESATV